MTVIAIIGGGVAGDEAAFAARLTDPGARVVLINKESYPLYSACVLADYVAAEIPRKKVFLRHEPDYEKAGIERRSSQTVVAWSPDQNMLHLTHGQLAYDRLVMATGSRTFIPPIPGSDQKGVLSLKTFDDAEQLKQASGKAAVVVGSGPVGIEAAVALRRRGWSVAIVELLDSILPRLFDAPLTGKLIGYLQAAGIDVFTGEKVEAIIGDGQVCGVQTNRRKLPADVVVLVIGMRPVVELAQSGGLATGIGGGILVDEFMETSRNGVWACGDCVVSTDIATGREGLFMLWNNARLQGRVAGANAAGARRRYPGSLNVTTVNFFQQAAASVGVLAADINEPDRQVFHRRRTWGEFWLVMENHCPVGVQVIGKTEKVGGLVGLIMRGQDLRRKLLQTPAGSSGADLWALQGFQEELLGSLS